MTVKSLRFKLKATLKWVHGGKMFIRRVSNTMYRQLNCVMDALKRVHTPAPETGIMVGFLKRRIKPMYKKWGLFLCLSKDGVVSQYNPMVHVLQFPYRRQRIFGHQYSL